MKTVAITGVSGALGRRVVSLLAERADWAVVGFDLVDFPGAVAKPRFFTVHNVDLCSAAIEPLLDGVDAIIHLAAENPDALGSGKPTDVLAFSRVLAAATARSISQVVLLSSAAVYGASRDNPVPLTENASLRPASDFVFATRKVEIETLANEWRLQSDDRKVAMLRPAVTLGHPDSRAWLARAVKPSWVDRLAHTLPVQQFVHIDDVASAAVHALDLALDGPFNVAPDGWLSADEAHELWGPNLRLPIPDQVVETLRRVAEPLLERQRPAGASTYARAAWVVANDRLRSTGWSPQSTSAEAFVASRRPLPGARFAARHRQEVTLAAVGTAATTAAGVAAWVVSRLRARRR